MRHAREDYNRIQDPEGKIAEDEPVFLLRAKDALAPNTLRHWADQLAWQTSEDDPLVRLAKDQADKMEEWARINGSKTPDL